MKLERNKNPDGRGKYAILKLSSIDAIHRMVEEHAAAQAKVSHLVTPDTARMVERNEAILAAVRTLEEAGLLVSGGPRADQFFVIRYQDMFAATALRAYGEAVCEHAESLRSQARTVILSDRDRAGADRLCELAASLEEYALDMFEEVAKAAMLDSEGKSKTPD